ncbi:hypothetical protein VMCG_07957 [Cytospora schulzeri]|uniref:Berberine/berberine-like domain-containing protein n=1 Tax=Cytospora schulzeri TaxID=448051 RepID=A0A423VY33_9PEZI|nr:hypothetical protein VMCG_07957 [Valsa malicola]
MGYYDLSTVDKQLTAFAEISSADPYDEYASLITGFGFEAGRGSAVVNNIVYTKAEANPADDAAMEEAARALFGCIENEAKKLDAYDPFVYLNYAAQRQDPLLIYGKESNERMKGLRAHVGPKGVFQDHVPGGFKMKD